MSSFRPQVRPVCARDDGGELRPGGHESSAPRHGGSRRAGAPVGRRFGDPWPPGGEGIPLFREMEVLFCKASIDVVLGTLSCQAGFLLRGFTLCFWTSLPVQDDTFASSLVVPLQVLFM